MTVNLTKHPGGTRKLFIPVHQFSGLRPHVHAGGAADTGEVNPNGGATITYLSPSSTLFGETVLAISAATTTAVVGAYHQMLIPDDWDLTRDVNVRVLFSTDADGTQGAALSFLPDFQSKYLLDVYNKAGDGSGAEAYNAATVMSPLDVVIPGMVFPVGVATYDNKVLFSGAGIRRRWAHGATLGTQLGREPGFMQFSIGQRNGSSNFGSFVKYLWGVLFEYVPKLKGDYRDRSWTGVA